MIRMKAGRMIEHTKRRIGSQGLNKPIVIFALILLALAGCSDPTNEKILINQNIKKNFISKVSELRNDNSNKSVHLSEAVKFSDWEKVCVVTPYTSFKGIEKNWEFRYEPNVSNKTVWMLVFIKDKTVVAELHIENNFLRYVDINALGKCIERKNADFVISQDRTKGFISEYFKFSN